MKSSSHKQRLDAFIHLGHAFKATSKVLLNKNEPGHLGRDATLLMDACMEASRQNPWFTRHFIGFALEGLSRMLEKNNLDQWTAQYPASYWETKHPGNIGVVMAGNIPLVGFHDLLCVLLTGHRFLGKPSTQDNILPAAIAHILTGHLPDLNEKINLSWNPALGADAAIATGSDNSARTFEFLLYSIPHIIRKNRHSLAILSGQESEEEFINIGKDVMFHFGLGCRNVSLIFIPHHMDPKIKFKPWEVYGHLMQNSVYQNNLLHQRALLSTLGESFHDMGFLLLREKSNMQTPVGCLHYYRYETLSEVVSFIETNRNSLQCVVTNSGGTLQSIPDTVSPGKSQTPMPWNYADNVDTIEFLARLEKAKQAPEKKENNGF